MLALSRGRKGALTAGVLIAIYFVGRTRLGLLTQFTHDDLMNCWRGVSRPLPKLLADCLFFFRPSGVFRPLGCLLYRAAFAVSGFNLFPLRVLLMILMGLTVVLVYCFARRLSNSREVAILTALLASYHRNFWAFYFNTGQLYDILCCFFYFAALVYYLRVRQEGRFLRWHEVLIFCALYAAALGSKELAVSLPVMIAVWELVFHPPSWRPSELARWARAGLLPALLTGLMTAAYIRGRVITPKGLGVAVSAYRPNYSWGAAFQTISSYINELFYATGYFDAKKTVALLLLLVAVAGLARSRSLLLCWVLLVAGILPMAFIPARVLV